jgi:hypothetical protein
MNRNTKNVIRVIVLAGLFAWPAVETYRYFVASENLMASEKVLSQVQTKLAQAKARHQSTVIPVSNQTGK